MGGGSDTELNSFAALFTPASDPAIQIKPRSGRHAGVKDAAVGGRDALSFSNPIACRLYIKPFALEKLRNYPIDLSPWSILSPLPIVNAGFQPAASVLAGESPFRIQMLWKKDLNLICRAGSEAIFGDAATDRQTRRLSVYFDIADRRADRGSITHIGYRKPRQPPAGTVGHFNKRNGHSRIACVSPPKGKNDHDQQGQKSNE